MKSLFFLTVLFLSNVVVFPLAQADRVHSEEPNGIRLDKSYSKRYIVGVVITAEGGACKGLYGTVPVPSDWLEQQVSIVDEEITSQVQSVQFRKAANGIEEMQVSIPFLAAGQVAKALVTYEITRYSTLPPENAERFELPKRLNRRYRQYMGASPFIEIRNSKIRRLAKQLKQKDDGAWQLVEAIHDVVRERIELKKGNLKGAAAALRDGYGNYEDRTSLFIALCRVHGIPARTVWVPDSCYAEFLLHDENASDCWVPCQLTGDISFGSTMEQRPILQKGDRFKIPGERRPVRFVPESLTGKSGGGQPRVTFIRTLTASE